MTAPRPRRQLVTIKIAAEHADVSDRTIKRYIASGRLRAYRVGPRLVKVDLADVEALAKPIPAAPPAAATA